jgi:hypothetical protein
MEERPVMDQHDVHFVYDGFEEAGGDAGAVELESSDVLQISNGIESDEWSDIRVLDPGKV